MVYDFDPEAASKETTMRILKPDFDPRTYVTKSVMGASDGLIKEWGVIKSEVEDEVSSLMSNFDVSFVLYDLTENYTNHGSFPYSKKKTVIGTYPIDISANSYQHEKLYLQKAEQCESENAFSKVQLSDRISSGMSYLKDGESDGSSDTNCYNQMIKLESVKPAGTGKDGSFSSGYTFVSFDMFLSPMVSTLIKNIDKDGDDFMDFLTKTGGFIVAIYCIIYPLGKYISHKLYQSSLIQSLYILKDDPKIKEVPLQTLDTDRINTVEALMEGGSPEKDNSDAQSLQVLFNGIQDRFRRIKLEPKKVLLNPITRHFSL